MNREAAALGVPVYSLFRGALGAVDKHLAETGKLVLLGERGRCAREAQNRAAQKAGSLHTGQGQKR